MTPTPLELRLWKALNPNGTEAELAAFAALSEWLRLAYFEGKVRERGWHIRVSEMLGAEFGVTWREDAGYGHVSVEAPTEHAARLTAAARALVALGIVEEIDDGND